MSLIPYGRQDVTREDIDAVVAVLQSDYLTQGPMVPAFEEAIADYCGAEFGVAASNATSALHLACLALGLGAGDWLWTSAMTFVASANCGLYCGAKVDFVDIDEKTCNLSVEKLEEKLIAAQKEGLLPKVVVPVHFSGEPCDMKRIHQLGQQYGFKIIEDASHAIGGRYLDAPIGASTWSDITVFSFHPVKIITSGEGGMAVTNQKALAEKMQLLRGHGITREPEKLNQADEGPWFYEQIELGFNYRMTDLQATLGLSQLSRITAYVTRRHALAHRYDSLLSGLPVSTPWRDPENYSGMHLYVIRLQLDAIATSHRQVFESLRAQGIGVNLHYIPVHLQPYYQQMGFQPGQYPAAERYYREAISLPLFPALEEAQQDQVVDALRKATCP